MIQFVMDVLEYVLGYMQCEISEPKILNVIHFCIPLKWKLEIKV